MRGRQELLRRNFTMGDGGMVGGYYPQGGLGSFLKKAGKAAWGAATSTLGQQALAVLPGGTAAVSAFNLYKSVKTGGKQGGPKANLQAFVPAMLGGPGGALSAAGGAGMGMMKMGGLGPSPLGPDTGPGGVPKGYHWSKPRKGQPQKLVRNRYMNALNPRALRRGMRRVQSFARFARRTISFTHRVKMKKRGRK